MKQELEIKSAKRRRGSISLSTHFKSLAVAVIDIEQQRAKESRLWNGKPQKFLFSSVSYYLLLQWQEQYIISEISTVLLLVFMRYSLATVGQLSFSNRVPFNPWV